MRSHHGKLLSLILSLVLTVSLLMTGGSVSVLAAAAAGPQWIDSELAGELTPAVQVSPQSDFYAYVNRSWILDYSASAANEGSDISVSTQMSAAVESRMKTLLTDTSQDNHDAQLVRDLYDILMDWDARNEAGIAPVMPFIAAIQQIDSLDELTEYLCSDALNLMGNGFSQIYISQYINNPDYYAVQIDPTDLLLSDPADYASISDNGKRQLALAQAQVYYMLGRIGYEDSEIRSIFRGCLVFETALSRFMYTSRDQNRSDYYTEITNRPCSRQQLAELAGDYPLLQILDARDLGDSIVYNVSQPQWLSAMAMVYTQDNLEYMKDYLLVHTAIPAMELTDREALDVRLQLLNRYGDEGQDLSDHDIAFHYVAALLPEVLDNAYIRKYCSPQEKEEVTGLVKQIVSFYHTMLEKEDWLSDPTKVEALRKLENMTVRVDYPDELPDYNGLVLKTKEDGGTLIEAFKTIGTWSRRQSASLVNQRLDDSHWAMYASTVNCFYNVSDNSINILAGMMTEPFYSRDMTREELLAGIGFVIGHEITHAFDADGSLYDETGQERNWWTQEDRAVFEEKEAALISCYDGIRVNGFGSYSGQQVASEATADLGSMKCMLSIAAQEDAFDYEAFFTRYASNWACVRSELAEMMYMFEDGHPLPYLRVNVLVQQFQEFYDTWDVQPGDGMYLSPELRLSIW